MHELTTANQTLGLTFCGKILKGALLAHQKGEVKVEKIFEVKNDFSSKQEEDVKPLYIPEVQQLQDEGSHLLIVTGLSTQEVLVRPLEIKLTKDKDVDAVFPFQSETLIPYSLENAVLDRIHLAKTEQSTQLTMLSARKDHLQAHIKKWEQMMIEPEVITATPLALAAFTKACVSITESSESLLYSLHIGEDSTVCLLTFQGKLVAAHTFPAGVNNLIEVFAKEKNLTAEESENVLLYTNFSEINKNETPLLCDAVQSLRQEISKTYYALCKYTKGQRIEEIFVTGKGGTFQNLSTVICEGLNKNLIVPEDAKWRLTTQQLQNYAVSIGLALTSLPNVTDQVNFRQQEFVYSNTWKRYKKPMAVYLGLCFLTALFLFLFGQSWIGYEEDKLKEKYAQALTLVNKSFNTVEGEYRLKNPEETSESDKQLKDFTQHDLLERIYFISRQLQASPETFPLQPNSPRVSDVLAWLSTHANMATKTADGDNWQPLVQIENFNYSMIKRPEFSKKNEKYQVKVEIEFSSPTPMLAREFHDALIAPNDLVDPKGDIKWSASKGKYRTSFFLKDKTVYQVGS